MILDSDLRAHRLRPMNIKCRSIHISRAIAIDSPYRAALRYVSKGGCLAAQFRSDRSLSSARYPTLIFAIMPPPLFEDVALDRRNSPIWANGCRHVGVDEHWPAPLIVVQPVLLLHDVGNVRTATPTGYCPAGGPATAGCIRRRYGSRFGGYGTCGFGSNS